METDDIQSQEETSSADASSEIHSSQTRSSKQQKLLVRMPFPAKTPQNKRRSKALKAARREIGQLKNDLEQEKRKTKRAQKRYERVSKKVDATPATIIASTSGTQGLLTPKSKTIADLRQAKVSPRSLPKAVVKQIEFGNCLISEINSSMRENSGQKEKSVVMRVFTGKVMKKHRFQKRLVKETGISRGHKIKSKLIFIRKRHRMVHQSLQLKEKVLSFYARDDVSRCMPGKKDAVKVDGQKEQVRILNDYLQNLHERFLAEDPSVKLSYSAFCKLRPRNIHVTALLSRNKCLCTKHQNMAMKLKSMIKYGIMISPNPEAVGRSTSKDDMTEKLASLKDVDSIEYEEWRSVVVDGKKKMKIVKVSVTGHDFILLMINQYELFLEHIQRVAAQYRALHDLKENLPQGHVIIQMDFAENVVCQTMDEIQSAYWNATAATLHPVVVYFRNETGDITHRNLVYVSDVNHHNATAVTVILKKLVPEVKSFYPEVTHIHYWTDSPSSQYRNRFMFNMVANHSDYFDNIKASWNYFECGHGKGPCDGIGGTSKRMAAQAIKQGKTTIQDGRDFYTWASANEKLIKYIFYSQDEYDASATYLASLQHKAVPGTMKLHAVRSAGCGVIHVRETSCYCTNCLHWNHPCDGWVKHELQTLPQPSMATSTSADEPSTSTTIEPSENRQSDTESTALRNTRCPFVGDMLAVKYDDDWFVGEVQQVDEEDETAFMTFMTKKIVCKKVSMQWPEERERDRETIWCSFGDIIMPVEVTQVGRSKRFYTISPDIVDAINDVLATM